MSDRGFDEAARRYREVRGTAPRDQLERTDVGMESFERAMGAYEEPLACGIEDPESCESCQ